MRSKTILIGSMMLAALLAGACAEPPQQEIDAAKAALAEAEAAEAEAYAPEVLQSAQQAMDAVQSELDAQQAKFALFRSYNAAQELASQAQAKAQEAVAAAEEGRQQAMEEAQAAVESAQATLAQAETLIGDLENCRRKPKGFATDLAALKGTLDGLDAELTTAEASLAGEEYAQAISQAESVNTQGATLVADLEAAKTKLGC